MKETSLSLTVYFEEPFWRGLYERRIGELYEVCKVIYGAEPKDQLLYEAILRGKERLDFAPALPAVKDKLGTNPKRRQRQIAKTLQQPAASTKAQAALKKQQEQQIKERQQQKRQRREAEQEKRFALRQAKRQARHKGR